MVSTWADPAGHWARRLVSTLLSVRHQYLSYEINEAYVQTIKECSYRERFRDTKNLDDCGRWNDWRRLDFVVSGWRLQPQSANGRSGLDF